MLSEFRVANFLSFKEEVTLSLVASSIKEHRKNNVIESDSTSILRGAVIYGANSSGKSNLIEAIRVFKSIVVNSSRESLIGQPLPIRYFKLCDNCESTPSKLEAIFTTQEGNTFRYGFESNSEYIISEWLYKVGKRKDSLLFAREKDDFIIEKGFKEGNGLEAKTRPNSLFLSVAAQFNGKTSIEIQKWFRNSRIISGNDESDFEAVTKNMLYKTNPTEEEKRKIDTIKSIIKGFLSEAGTEIIDIQVEEVDVRSRLPLNEFPSSMHERIIEISKDSIGKKVIFIRNKYDENGNIIGTSSFNLEEEESEGIKKIFKLIGPIIYCLMNGRLMIIDELDSRLHPVLTRKICSIFHKYTNPEFDKKAQLIFSTHDATLLSSHIFRRDQVWFTEKNKQGATELYSLAEYKISSQKVRNDASFSKDYLEGRYGAIPFFGGFDFNQDAVIHGITSIPHEE